MFLGVTTHWVPVKAFAGYPFAAMDYVFTEKMLVYGIFLLNSVKIYLKQVLSKQLRCAIALVLTVQFNQVSNYFCRLYKKGVTKNSF